MKHLAIFKGDSADLILSGEKTIETRFSTKKSVPFQTISVGDLVYIKPSGKEIIGEFRVKKVIFYNGLESEDIADIKKRYGKQIAMDESFWQGKESYRYLTLIFIAGSNRFLTAPIKFPKKDLRGWVVLKG